MAIFRRCKEGLASGDAIPFYHDGVYHLFFLASPKGTDYFPERLCCGWKHVISRDLVKWETLPDAIEPSPVDGLDAGGCWTGSAIFANGLYHIFYTGYCPGAEYPQTVCHAVSKDGVDWTKDPNNPILLPNTTHYEKDDWRDPYVFFNEEENCYWMLLSARKNTGVSNRRGCVVLYKSSDLLNFEHYGTIYEPNETSVPECPEVYKMGEYWYLCFSRFSERSKTTYCYSRSPYGPWRMPKYDGIDGRRCYAAKSLCNSEGRRFYFGWIYERLHHNDQGDWQWGGDFGIPHEVCPDGNGNLKVFMPTEVYQEFSREVPATFTSITGDESMNDGKVEISAISKLSYGFFDIPYQDVMFECDMTIKESCDYFGLAINTDNEINRGYQLVFDYQMQRVFLNKLPLPNDAFWTRNLPEPLPAPEVDAPHVIEKPFEMKEGNTYNIKVVFSNEIFEIFVDDTIVISYRAYEKLEHMIGLFAQDSTIEWKNLHFYKEGVGEV